ncbi:sel1 repeat family protein [Seongchinamella unica]|uniref:Sel1 repeat family protein n=1 Tax=Seongchinamella unica TaxID=2547392 RepID=A0A4V2ZWU3_9GAMM|nr:sel1 repeat family protein [Seongchinamella unica]TDG11592.1 sel1 repeat family protein [Seongchinamella unica]
MLYLIAAVAALILAFVIWQRRRPEAPASPEPEPLHLGIKAYMREDYARAEPVLRHHAEAGELKAQQLLAKMYYSGHGVPQDRERYLHWLEQAAAQGDRSAKARLKAARKQGS